MPRNKSGSANGGVIGKTNKSSFGKCTQTVITSNTPSAVTTQPGTRLVKALVVAGGAGGGGGSPASTIGGGGGGAGGLRNLEIPVCGNSALGAVTIGGGGSGGSGTSTT